MGDGGLFSGRLEPVGKIGIASNALLWVGMACTTVCLPTSQGAEMGKAVSFWLVTVIRALGNNQG